VTVKRVNTRMLRGLVAAVTAIVFLLAASTVLATTVLGPSVRATVTNGKVTFVAMAVRARCTNGSYVIEEPGFQVPFAHPQNSSGHFADSYSNLVGKGRLTGQLLHASFTATIDHGKITGTVTAGSVFSASHVRCSGGPFAFHAP
jgi:hypothetical protein